MIVNAESYGHAVIINLKGEIAEDDLAALRQSVDHQLAAKEVVDIVLNMENVTFIDSAGLEYLIDLQDRLAERLGRVRLLKCDENVLKILEITRSDSLFDLFQNAEEAVKAVGD